MCLDQPNEVPARGRAGTGGEGRAPDVNRGLLRVDVSGMDAGHG